MFVGVDSRGVPLVIGIAGQPEPKWMGAKASDLLLLGIATCSGVDVTGILEKQRQAVVDLEIKVTGEQEQSPPWKFTRVQIEYVIRGKNLKEPLVKQAIELSEEKYCSVLATIRPTVEIHTHYRLEEV